MKDRYDRSARDPKFMLGDRVWVYTPKTQKGLSRKLMNHWHGTDPLCGKMQSFEYYLLCIVMSCDIIFTSIH